MEVGPYIGGLPAVSIPMTRRVLNITIYDDLLTIPECRAIEASLKEYLEIAEDRYMTWTLRQDMDNFPPDEAGGA